MTEHAKDFLRWFVENELTVLTRSPEEFVELMILLAENGYKHTKDVSKRHSEGNMPIYVESQDIKAVKGWFGPDSPVYIGVTGNLDWFTYKQFIKEKDITLNEFKNLFYRNIDVVII